MLFFTLSLPRGPGEKARRSPRRDILSSIKTGEVLSDDLVGAVAFDALRPAVPGRHFPRRIDHINRDVMDAFHEHPETLLRSV